MTNLSSTAGDVLASARSLIVAGGYNGFSYADIAKVVGIRKASIHQHFPTKADLVYALVQQYRADTEEGLVEVVRAVPAPLDQLASYLGYWEACIADGSRPFCVCTMLATELEVLPEAVARAVTAYFRMLSAWIVGVLGRGAAEGGIKLQDTPEREAGVVMATVHGAMLLARAYGDSTLFRMITASLLLRFR